MRRNYTKMFNKPKCSFQNFRTRKPKKSWHFDKHEKENTQSTSNAVGAQQQHQNRFGPEEPLRCGACLLNPTLDQCLLVKQRDGKWGFPKGSFETVKDSSHEACMIREVQEETGINLTLHDYDTMYTIVRYRYQIYVLHMKEAENAFTICPEDNNEIEQVKWVSWRDFHQYALNYVTKHVLYRTHMRNKLGWNLKRQRNCATDNNHNNNQRNCAIGNNNNQRNCFISNDNNNNGQRNQLKPNNLLDINQPPPSPVSIIVSA